MKYTMIVNNKHMISRVIILIGVIIPYFGCDHPETKYSDHDYSMHYDASLTIAIKGHVVDGITGKGLSGAMVSWWIDSDYPSHKREVNGDLHIADEEGYYNIDIDTWFGGYEDTSPALVLYASKENYYEGTWHAILSDYEFAEMAIELFRRDESLEVLIELFPMDDSSAQEYTDD